MRDRRLQDALRRPGRALRETHSDLVVLPEMPFGPWLAARDPDAADRAAARKQTVASHDRWLGRLDEFGDAAVVGSRPVVCEARHDVHPSSSVELMI